SNASSGLLDCVCRMALRFHTMSGKFHRIASGVAKRCFAEYASANGTLREGTTPLREALGSFAKRLISGHNKQFKTRAGSVSQIINNRASVHVRRDLAATVQKGNRLFERLHANSYTLLRCIAHSCQPATLLALCTFPPRPSIPALDGFWSCTQLS